MNYVDLILVSVTQYGVLLFSAMNITDAFQFLLDRSTSENLRLLLQIYMFV